MLVIGEGEEHIVPDLRREEILDWPERDETFRHQLEDFYERGMDIHTKWHGHNRDTIRLSKAFPEVLFVL